MPLEDLQHIIPDRFLATSTRKTQLVLASAVAVLVLVCVALVVTLAVRRRDDTSRSAGCVTVACLRASSHLLRNVDPSVRPCDDFFRYACGGWLNRTALPVNRLQISTYTLMYQRHDAATAARLEAPIRRRQPGSAERKMKDFFRTCVHDYGRMKDSGRRLADVIVDGLGGWYVFSPEQVPSDWDWQTALAKLHDDYTVHALLQLDVMQSPTDRTKAIPALGIGDIGMFFELYQGDEFADSQTAYKDYMRFTARLVIKHANITVDSAELHRRIEQFVADVYAVEEKMAKIMGDNQMTIEWWGYKTTTIGDLQTDYPQINWLMLFRRVYDAQPMSRRTKVEIVHALYFRALDDYLREESNIARIMNNLLVWSLIDTYARDLSWEYTAAKNRLTEKIYGHVIEEPTWKRCLRKVTHNIGPILMVELLTAKDETDVQEKAMSLLKTLRDSLLHLIDQTTWMDKISKARAKEKLKASELLVTLPHNFVGWNTIDRLYSKMRINASDTYLDNLISVHRQQRRLSHESLLTSHRAYVWLNYMHSALFGVTPTFVGIYNQLFVPVGALQFPQFSGQPSDVITFAGLGVSAARKLVRAVNFRGAETWTNGSSGNWWTPATRKNYKTLVRECLSKYFDTLTAGPFTFNGRTKTVKVNGAMQIARAAEWVSGLKIAFYALKRSRSDDQLKAKLVGMDLNEEQAFFVAHAQNTCFRQSEEKTYHLASLQRMPASLVMNGALSHVKEFSDAFHCADKSKMKAETRCEVF